MAKKEQKWKLIDNDIATLEQNVIIYTNDRPKSNRFVASQVHFCS